MYKKIDKQFTLKLNLTMQFCLEIDSKNFRSNVLVGYLRFVTLCKRMYTGK